MGIRNLSRRNLFKLGGAATFVAVAGTACSEDEEEPKVQEVGQYTLPYPQNELAKAADLEVGETLAFNYPDEDSPCVLLKTGEQVPAGVGPDNDIVGYSTLCTHKGCPVGYNKEARLFVCGCHFSSFDPDRGGQMVCGQATVNLPQIVLSYDKESDALTARGVKGLIYGRVSNVLTIKTEV